MYLTCCWSAISYHPSDHLVDTLVINVGDVMPYLTNGAFKAARHRVINKSSNTDRHVALMFYEPNLEMPIQPVKKFKDRTCPFTAFPSNFGTHLSARFAATYTGQ